MGALAGGDVSLEMEQLQTQGSHARVRVRGWAASVVGWVAQGDLAPQQMGLLGLLRSLGDAPAQPSVTCEREVDLLVIVDGERHVVGQLHAGATVPVVAENDRPIALRLSGSPLNDMFASVSGEPLHPLRPVLAPEQAASCRVATPPSD